MARFTTPDGVTIAYDQAGQGPPVLLLHGFPQTRALWSACLPLLSKRFTVVTADLRGYGASSKPVPAPDLSNYSFRAMGADMLALMSHLGFDRFHLAGHDRGGRVAHRMALDAPGRVRTLALMDIVPTDWLLDHWSAEVSQAYFHWSFLAQPAPLAERMIAADPDHFFEACLTGWGGAKPGDFPEIAAYRAAWRDADAIRGMCADYRAAVSVDTAADRADRGRHVTCPALLLYGADGVMARHFDISAAWSAYLSDATARAIPGGHFFVDYHPDATAAALLAHWG